MTPNCDGRRMGGILEFEYTLATDSESTPTVLLDGITFEVVLDSMGRGLTAAELCECLLIQNHLDQYGCLVLIPIPVGTHPIIHTPLHACAAQVQRSTTTDRDVYTSAPPRWTCEPRWGRLMDGPTDGSEHPKKRKRGSGEPSSRCHVSGGSSMHELGLQVTFSVSPANATARRRGPRTSLR